MQGRSVRIKFDDGGQSGGGSTAHDIGVCRLAHLDLSLETVKVPTFK